MDSSSRIGPLVLGYYFSVSKLEKLDWPSFESRAWKDRGLKCVPMDLDREASGDAEEKDGAPPATDHMDMLLYKVTDEMAGEDAHRRPEHAARLHRLRRILDRPNGPAVVDLEPADCQRTLIDRLALATLVVDLERRVRAEHLSGACLR